MKWLPDWLKPWWAGPAAGVKHGVKFIDREGRGINLETAVSREKYEADLERQRRYALEVAAQIAEGTQFTIPLIQTSINGAPVVNDDGDDVFVSKRDVEKLLGQVAAAIRERI